MINFRRVALTDRLHESNCIYTIKPF